MDKAFLVSYDVARGLDLIKALEAANIKVNVALWAVLSEYGDWRLVISARQFDSLDLTDAYMSLHELLKPAGFTAWNTPVVMILPMSDPFIKDLRRYFKNAKGVEGARVGLQTFGDRFVEDGFVYRMS